MRGARDYRNEGKRGRGEKRRRGEEGKDRLLALKERKLISKRRKGKDWKKSESQEGEESREVQKDYGIFREK